MQGVILKTETFDHYPWVCSHDIPGDRPDCLCGKRIAVASNE